MNLTLNKDEADFLIFLVFDAIESALQDTELSELTFMTDLLERLGPEGKRLVKSLREDCEQ